MIGQFFWRLGMPLAVLWYLGAVAMCIATSDGMPWQRENSVILLLVIGPIGSAALALFGTVVGCVAAGLSMIHRAMAIRRQRANAAAIAPPPSPPTPPQASARP
jgi:hypothetical protein